MTIWALDRWPIFLEKKRMPKWWMGLEHQLPRTQPTQPIPNMWRSLKTSSHDIACLWPKLEATLRTPTTSVGCPGISPFNGGKKHTHLPFSQITPKSLDPKKIWYLNYDHQLPLLKIPNSEFLASPPRLIGYQSSIVLATLGPTVIQI